MFLLGMMSIAQVVFLPGFLALRMAGLASGRPHAEDGSVGCGILRTLLFSFGLSLVLNHFLVLGLTLIGCYRPAVLYAIFAAEAASLLAVFRGTGCLRIQPGQRLMELVRELSRDGEGKTVPFHRMLVLVALLVVTGVAVDGLSRTGEIFHQWDAVVSWNRWAIDWSHGALPQATGMYPQLLPANLSLTYVFLQDSSLWFFAKGWQFLFVVSILANLLDMARTTKVFGYVIGVPIAYWLLIAALRYRNLSSGYADVPVAAFACLAVHALLLARQADEARRLKWLILGAVLCSGAALTKQAGLYLAVAYPLLAWQLVLRRARPYVDKSARPILVCLILMAVLIAPWYIGKQIEFHQGQDASNTAYLLGDIHEGRDVAQRLAHAGELLVAAVTVPGAMLIVALLAAAMFDPLQRRIAPLLVVGYALVWAVGFSYDLRNVALAIPFAAAAAGVGLTRALQVTTHYCENFVAARTANTKARRGTRLRVSEARALPSQSAPSSLALRAFVRTARHFMGSARMYRVTLGHMLAVAVVLLVALNLRLDANTLHACQQTRLNELGSPALNQALATRATARPVEGLIASDYLVMQWLPGLGDHFAHCDTRNLATFRQTFERPTVHCALLLSNKMCPPVRKYLDADRGARHCRLVFESQNYRFYEKLECGAP